MKAASPPRPLRSSARECALSPGWVGGQPEHDTKQARNTRGQSVAVRSRLAGNHTFNPLPPIALSAVNHRMPPVCRTGHSLAVTGLSLAVTGLSLPRSAEITYQWSLGVDLCYSLYNLRRKFSATYSPLLSEAQRHTLLQLHPPGSAIIRIHCEMVS